MVRLQQSNAGCNDSPAIRRRLTHTSCVNSRDRRRRNAGAICFRRDLSTGRFNNRDSGGTALAVRCPGRRLADRGAPRRCDRGRSCARSVCGARRQDDDHARSGRTNGNGRRVRLSTRQDPRSSTRVVERRRRRADCPSRCHDGAPLRAGLRSRADRRAVLGTRHRSTRS